MAWGAAALNSSPGPAQGDPSPVSSHSRSQDHRKCWYIRRANSAGDPQDGGRESGPNFGGGRPKLGQTRSPKARCWTTCRCHWHHLTLRSRVVASIGAGGLDDGVARPSPARLQPNPTQIWSTTTKFGRHRPLALPHIGRNRPNVDETQSGVGRNNLSFCRIRPNSILWKKHGRGRSPTPPIVKHLQLRSPTKSEEEAPLRASPRTYHWPAFARFLLHPET